MTSRREVLQIGVAATVLPLDATRVWAAPSAAAGRDETVALYKALYDTRFAASRAFGARMEAHGVQATAMTGDMTAFWYENLDPQWRKGAAAIAGLTARGPLFCLERLAWDHGMRVVFRAQHSLSAGSVQHEIEGTGALIDAVRQGAEQGDWVSMMSDVIAHYPSTGTPNARVLVHTPRPVVEVPEDEMLFSWVIAPIARS